MTTRRLLAFPAAACALGWAMPAWAQDEAAALRDEVAAIRAEMQVLEERMNALQRRLAETAAADPALPASPDAGPVIASAPAATSANTAPASAPALPAPEPAPEPAIAWQGAPRITGEGGWSFKPFGRLQYDIGSVSAPDGIDDPGLGFATEARRIRFGFRGTVPGGLGYKFEVDFADGAELYDAFISYTNGDFEARLGQQNNFQGLEELTSSRFISFMERAAFTDAFQFERRVGLSGQLVRGPLIVQAGAFTDNVGALDDDGNDSIGLDGRVVVAPELENTQLHFGGSVHYVDLGDTIDSMRYRQRPFVHTSDVRFIDTGSIPASAETGYGLEAAAIAGRLHFAGEAFWQSVSVPGAGDPTFFGGSAEVGLFLTPGDTRGYEDGAFDRARPARPIGEGGIGAIQVNARYDRLDLVDAGIVGGVQDGYALSVIWTLTDYTRLMASYARLQYSDAALPAAGGDSEYGVDSIGMRAEIDF